MAAAAPQGRIAYERRAWGDAFEALSAAKAAGPLEADDVERLAWSALFTGRDERSHEAFAELHQRRLEAGEPLAAARAAVWLGLRLMSLGEVARASGWLAKAQRLVEQAGGDSVERGYLMLPQVFRLTAARDHEAARAAAS